MHQEHRLSYFSWNRFPNDNLLFRRRNWKSEDRAQNGLPKKGITERQGGQFSEDKK